MKQNDKVIWNSPKGYSIPNEVVTIVEVVEDSDFCIKSEPDAGESPEFSFFYWVNKEELTPIQEKAYHG